MVEVEDKKLRKVLVEGALQLGIELNAASVESFIIYLRELKLWNSKINITAIRDESEIVIKHFLDSLTPFRILRQQGIGSLFDIGAGGGFPGLPLKVVMPEIELALLDSVAKKVHFMRHIIRRLGLGDVTGAAAPVSAIAARVEAHGELREYEGRFDCVTSRAFASLSDFVTAADYFCRPGGLVLALKGPKYAMELEAYMGTGGQAGFGAPEVFEVAVPFTDRTTTLVSIKKEG